MTKLAKLVVWSLLPVGLLIFLIAPFSSHSIRQGVSAVQILAGPDEMWFFIEVGHVVGRSDLLASPRSWMLDHHQEVLVVSESGAIRRIPISVPEGMTRGVMFHPNISHIFRIGNDTYLFEDFSMNTHRSLYQWRNNHFALLPLDESESLLKKHSLNIVGPDDDTVNENQLAEGWSNVFKDTGYLFESTFKWKGHRFELAIINRSENISLQLRRLDQPWTADLITFDGTLKTLSRSEFDTLWERFERHQKGHPR